MRRGTRMTTRRVTGEFTPVAVSRAGQRVTVRWDPFEDTHAMLRCRKV